MNFITFNLTLLVATLPAFFLYSFGLAIFIAPILPFAIYNKPLKILAFPLAGLLGLFQIYFWTLWAAFCVAMTYRYTSKPEVSWDWLYFVFGFSWSTSLIGWMGSKELQSCKSEQETTFLNKGIALYSLVIMGAYIVFAIWPNLILTPYAWALKPLGFERYIASKTINGAEIDEKTHNSVEGFSGTPYEVHCQEPLPIFTLGEHSNPTKEQEAVLCACIWKNLGTWEREVAAKIGRGKDSEISWLYREAFPSRFGNAVEKCGGMKL